MCLPVWVESCHSLLNMVASGTAPSFLRRNIAITRHRVESEGLSPATLGSAIVSLDTKVINPELADILLRQVPTEDEVKAFRRYELTEQKPLSALSDEDLLVRELTMIDKLTPRLNMITIMSTFAENCQTLQPVRMGGRV